MLNILPRFYPFLLLAAASICAYSLVYSYRRSFWAGVLGGVIYSVNPIAIWLVFASYAPLAAYSLFPALFVSFDQVLVHKKLKHVLVFNVLFLVYTTLSSVHLAYLGVLALLMASLLHIFLTSFRDIRTTIRILVIATTFSAGVLSYQVLPFIVVAPNTPYLSTVYHITEAQRYAQTMLESVAFHAGALPYEQSLLSNFQVVCIGLLLPVLAFSALLLRRDKYTVFFTVLACTSIFVSKGPSAPFGELFHLLWNNVPGFAGIRRPTTWGFLTSLSYSFLVPTAILELGRREISTKVISSLERIAVKGLHVVTQQTTLKHLRVALLSLLVVLAMFVQNSIYLFPPHNFSTFDPSGFKEFDESEAAYALIASSEASNELFYILPVAYPWLRIKDYGQIFVPHTTANPVHYYSFLGNRPLLFFPEYDIVGSSFIPTSPDEPSFLYNLMTNIPTDQFMKIIGALNVKYVFLPHTHFYAAETGRPVRELMTQYGSFFSFQEGASLFFSGDALTVYRNEFSFPHIYSSSPIIVVGGLNALVALGDIPSFDFAGNAILYAWQNGALETALTYSRALLLNDLTFTDLLYTMLLPESSCARINRQGIVPLADIERSVIEKYWVDSRWWFARGEMVTDYLTARTRGTSMITVSCEVVGNPSYYSLLIRAANAPDTGLLTVLVDGEEVMRLNLASPLFYGFSWYDLPLQLQGGNHVITLKNDGTGLVDIDEVLLVKADVIMSMAKHLTEAIRNSYTRLVFLWEAEKFFGPNLPKGWELVTLEVDSTNTLVIRGKDATNEDSFRFLWIPKDSYYRIAWRGVVGSNYGRLHLVIDQDRRLVFNFARHADNKYEWAESEPVWLKAGLHKFLLESDGLVDVDKFLLYSIDAHEKTMNVRDLFAVEKNVYVEFAREKPYKYRVHVKANDPFLLILCERSNPLWRAYVDNAEIRPVVVNLLFNGFYINKKGQFEITLEFIGQKYLWVGGALSITTLLVMALLVLHKDGASRWKADHVVQKARSKRVFS